MKKGGEVIKINKYNFVTSAELMSWTNEWIKSFPTSYDLIIGLPRSGLMVASIIATKLAKPLTTPDFIIEGRVWVSKRIKKRDAFSSILMVDDSINSGSTMKKSLELLQSNCDWNITTAALLATEATKNLVDLYYKIIPQPRIFEWNIMHSKRGKHASEMDGVICENCPSGLEADEKLYVEWLKRARPYLIPSFEIDVILANRLERYRPQTEEWLKQHQVRYKELRLFKKKSKIQRQDTYVQKKIKELLQIKPSMYWESNFGQAIKIWKATKIPTICIEKMVMMCD